MLNSPPLSSLPLFRDLCGLANSRLWSSETSNTFKHGGPHGALQRGGSIPCARLTSTVECLDKMVAKNEGMLRTQDGLFSN